VITQRAKEAAAVVATGAGHLVLSTWLHKQAVFIIAAALFWIGFVLVRLRRDREAFRRWGFGWKGFALSARMLAPFAALALVGTLVYGLLAHTLVFSWRFLLLLAVYPLWGLVQQFLVVGLLAANVRKGTRLPEWAVLLATVLVFAAIHLPSVPLAVVAGLMVGVTSFVYFRAGNLPAAGIFHGAVATFAYFFVLGEDPLGLLIKGGIWP